MLFRSWNDAKLVLCITSRRDRALLRERDRAAAAARCAPKPKEKTKKSPYADVKRGPLSPDEGVAIDLMADSSKKPTAGMIAQRLNRHRSTVHSRMIAQGMLEAAPRYSWPSYQRADGRRVNPYTEAEDRRLLGLRRAGRTAVEIAEMMTREFGKPRDHRAIQARLARLAGVSHDGHDDQFSLKRTA